MEETSYEAFVSNLSHLKEVLGELLGSEYMVICSAHCSLCLILLLIFHAAVDSFTDTVQEGAHPLECFRCGQVGKLYLLHLLTT